MSLHLVSILLEVVVHRVSGELGLLWYVDVVLLRGVTKVLLREGVVEILVRLLLELRQLLEVSLLLDVRLLQEVCLLLEVRWWVPEDLSLNLLFLIFHQVILLSTFVLLSCH